jgi:asparagine synthase (glutamine-hydrolysing)
VQWSEATLMRRPPKAEGGSHGAAAPLVGDFFTRMQLADLASYLPDDILTKVDRATMAVALECRAPLLDRRVVEFALRLPHHLKVRDGIGKWALRRVLARYVPEPLFDRPKVGFSVPLGSWLRGPLRPWAESLLDRRCLDEAGLLDPTLITERWQQHLAGRRDWSAHLWTILMLQAWLESTASATVGSPGAMPCVAVYAGGQSTTQMYGNAANIVS